MAPSKWEGELEQWLAPFLARLDHPAQQHWAPVYLRGLLGPSERKSVEPLAQQVAPGEVQQLHHFLSTSAWDPAPLEERLVQEATRLVGGPKAVLIVDDTALRKQGRHSVGVARQYCGEVGNPANCQCLVSLTLAQGQVPIPLALRLYLPESWASDPARCRRAGVPEAEIRYRPKWQIALDELDRLRRSGAQFRCVLGDADYGASPAFRAGLSERGLRWALAVMPQQQVYSLAAGIRTHHPRKAGAQPKYPQPTERSRRAEAVIASLPLSAWETFSWRRGSKGELRAAFAAVRVQIADGPITGSRRHLPGQMAWLVCEQRASGERRYYLTNHPASLALKHLVQVLKARWSCEQAHQQMKNELGLDHLECRNWRALTHHTLLTLLAYCFLQHLRLGGKKRRAAPLQPQRSPSFAFAARGAPSTPVPDNDVPLVALPRLPSEDPLPDPSMRLAE